MRRVLALVTLALLGLGAQDLLPPEVLLLSRIRAHVRETVDRLPDCTCVETVARQVTPPGKKPYLLDTVVLQILFSGGRELFASPGDTHWEAHPAGFVASGLMGDGVFASHLGAVFLNNQSVIRYHGRESSGGHEWARYDFTISKLRSGFEITREGVSGVVGLTGSFWADPQTYDLDRMEFHAAGIPPELHYADLTTTISYGRVRIADAGVLLPEEASMRVADSDGGERRNRIQFTLCHGFAAESTLRFDPAENAPAAVSAPATASLPPPPPEEFLPAQLRVVAAFTAPLDDHAAVGSLIQGQVTEDVLLKRKVVVPAGALLEGRVRRLEKHDEFGGFFIVALEFLRIQTPQKSLRFYAGLLELGRHEGVGLTFHNVNTQAQSIGPDPSQAAATQTVEERVWTHDLPGVGTFFVHGSHFSLPAGFHTIWRTR